MDSVASLMGLKLKMQFGNWPDNWSEWRMAVHSLACLSDWGWVGKVQRLAQKYIRSMFQVLIFWDKTVRFGRFVVHIMCWMNLRTYYCGI